MTILYPAKDGLYVNLTNRCPCSCTFCLRQNQDGVYGSDSLWLEHEPSFEEILEELKKQNLTQYNELVFCGYGEPTERLDVLLQVAAYCKRACPSLLIRINTNGLADLIWKKPTAQQLKGLIDTVSILSLIHILRVDYPTMNYLVESPCFMCHFTAHCLDRMQLVIHNG